MNNTSHEDNVLSEDNDKEATPGIHDAKLEDSVPWAKQKLDDCISLDTGIATGITPRKNEYYDGVLNNDVPMETDAEFATGITPRKNEYHGVPKENAEELIAKITPWKNEYHDEFVTGITPRKNAADSSRVSLEFTGITPWTNESHNKFVTGITPRKHECHVKYVASPGGNAGYFENITPRKNDTKNEIINFAPAVTDIIQIPPWEAPSTNLHSSTLEDNIP